MAPDNGKRLVEETLANIDAIRIGKSFSWLARLDSTNAHASSLAQSGAEDGTVVISEVQNAGHGRLDRQWISPKGGLWLSIILRPKIAPKDAAIITLMGACAVVKTLKSTAGIDARIKWPNDVLISGRKVCGILTEMRTRGNEIDFVVLGLGVNANVDVKEFPEDIRVTATSLNAECGEDVSIGNLLTSLILDIDLLYDRLLSGDLQFIIDMWKGMSDTLGQRVRIVTLKDSIEGIAVDLDDSGALTVKTEDGKMREIIAGDCVHLARVQ